MEEEKDMELPEEIDDDSENESEHGDTFCDHLTASIYEEMKDAGKYDELAKRAAEEYPDRGYDAILRDISREETIHLRHLEDILFDIKKLR